MDKGVQVMAKKRSIYDKLRLDEPRESATHTFHCHAPAVLFLPEFTDMPKDIQAAFRNGSLKIACQGGGCVGPWCTDCEFGDEEAD